MGNIAIDGPAGAGKSTIAKSVAKSLGFLYVDTGALYRALAYYVLSNNIDGTNEELVGVKLNDCLIKLGQKDGSQTVSLNGEDVTGLLRKEDVGNMASKISSYAAVRDKLLSVQRDTAKEQNVVMDGRDIGTVVLPDAKLKVYLTASPEERAKRRFLELKEKGVDSDIDKIKQDIINRDNQDMTRTIAPLKQAEDAILIDSSNMTINQVCEKIISLYEEA